MVSRLYHWVFIFWIVFVHFFFQLSLGFCGWIYFQNHLHSQSDHTFSRFPDSTSYAESYSAQGIQFLIEKAKQEGIRSIAITDHNTISHWFDPVFKDEQKIIMINAEEWTNMFGGHATLMGFKAHDETDAIVPRHPRSTLEAFDYEEMIQKVHERGGLVSINHPKSMYFFHRWPDSTYDADGVELNYSDFMLPRETLDWWHGLLRSGKRMFLLGGSDYHCGSILGGEPFSSTNLLWVEEETAEGVLSAIRHGKIQVLRSKTSPQVSGFYAIGIFNSLPQTFTIGENIQLAPLQHLLLQIEVSAGKNDMLTLWNRSGKVREISVPSNQFIHVDEYISDGSKDFLRIEISDASGSLMSVTNPIYMNWGAP